MAKDLKIKHVCPHFVVREWLGIEEDRKTLIPIRNASSRDVTLHVNGHEVPTSGFHAPVSFTGLRRGPYSIQKNVTDVLRFTVDQGTLQEVFLPTGSKVPLTSVVREINAQVRGVTASNDSNVLRLTTDSSGPQSSLYLQGGNGHEPLGLADTRFYKGRTLTPSWSLVRNIDTVDTLERFIRFDQKVVSTSDIWEVSYFTRRQECRRCSGLGIENDIRFDARGEVVLVTGIDLLAQEVEKITFTIRGSNIFYNWYGTSISDLIGTKIIRGGTLIESQLLTEIGNTLEKFRSVKAQQATLQPVTDQEYFSKIQSLSVLQDDVDPTVFRIRIDIQNAAQEVAQLTQTLALTGTSSPELVG